VLGHIKHQHVLNNPEVKPKALPRLMERQHSEIKSTTLFNNMEDNSLDGGIMRSKSEAGPAFGG
jgi:hypothetical protein